MSFWDFASSNPITAVIIVFLLVSGIETIAHAIGSKRK